VASQASLAARLYAKNAANNEAQHVALVSIVSQAALPRIRPRPPGGPDHAHPMTVADEDPDGPDQAGLEAQVPLAAQEVAAAHMAK
jgi:hypothetical protein